MSFSCQQRQGCTHHPGRRVAGCELVPPPGTLAPSPPPCQPTSDGRARSRPPPGAGSRPPAPRPPGGSDGPWRAGPRPSGAPSPGWPSRRPPARTAGRPAGAPRPRSSSAPARVPGDAPYLAREAYKSP
eukprot:607751-Prorocentrum_minimum.AAC.1